MSMHVEVDARPSSKPIGGAGSAVECSCGIVFKARTLDEARGMLQSHFNLHAPMEPVEGVVEPEAPRTQVIPFAPAAGEVIDLSNRQRVAQTIAELDEWIELVLNPIRAELRNALIEEADTQAAYTLRYGTIEVKVDGPSVGKYEWRDDLQPMLTELVLAGMPEERAAAMASETRKWKVNHTEINRAVKNDAYRAIIERYRTKQPRNRTVTVKRGPSA